MASAWEAAIKQSLGKLVIPEAIENGVRQSGFERLLITFAHTEAAGLLERHHRDPFDRVLLAQAQKEELTLVTRDAKLEAYGLPILWA